MHCGTVRMNQQNGNTHKNHTSIVVCATCHGCRKRIVGAEVIVVHNKKNVWSRRLLSLLNGKKALSMGGGGGDGPTEGKL